MLQDKEQFCSFFLFKVKTQALEAIRVKWYVVKFANIGRGYGKNDNFWLIFWRFYLAFPCTTKSTIYCALHSLSFYVILFPTKEKGGKHLRKHNKVKRWFALLLATVFSITAIGMHPAFMVEAEAQPKATVQNANVQLTRNGEAMYRKGLLIDDEVYVHLYLFTRNRITKEIGKYPFLFSI